MRDLGSIDILINNAGVIRRAPAVVYFDEGFGTDVLNINLNSGFVMCLLAGLTTLPVPCAAIRCGAGRF